MGGEEEPPETPLRVDGLTTEMLPHFCILFFVFKSWGFVDKSKVARNCKVLFSVIRNLEIPFGHVTKSIWTI